MRVHPALGVILITALLSALPKAPAPRASGTDKAADTSSAGVGDGESISPSGISLVIQTDSEGELRPCACPGDPPAGLARRAGLFRRLRSIRKAAVFVDGGDFAPPLDDTNPIPLADLMMEAMEFMAYDAVCPGEHELALGVGYMSAASERLPLVCANLEIAGLEIPPVRWIEAGGRRIAVTGIIEPQLYYEWPGAFSDAGLAVQLSDPLEALHGLRDSLAQAHAVIVLAHTSLEYLLFAAGELDGIDVFVHGHQPELEPHPTRVGEALVIEPGPLSTHVFELRMNWESEQAEPQSDLDVWLIKSLKRVDQRVERLVERFEAAQAPGQPDEED